MLFSPLFSISMCALHRVLHTHSQPLQCPLPFPSQVRYIVYHESLWRVSAQAFNAVVPAGLPALAAAATAGEDTAASWEALADAFETFLLVRWFVGWNAG